MTNKTSGDELSPPSGAASVPPPAGIPPSADVSEGLKFLGGCLMVTLEIAALLALIFLGPLVALALVMYFWWPWFSSGTRASDLDDALIALASVAGVLWSGAIIAYSIHKKYTPPLRTGVQLLHFAILAPLVGLIGSGWALRTAFYLFAYFYMLSTLYSMTNLELLKPGKISFKLPENTPAEAEAAAKMRAAFANLKAKELFQRIAHGTRYFAFVALLCAIIFVNAGVVAIAWSCLIVIVISLSMMLPQIFGLVDDPPPSASS